MLLTRAPLCIATAFDLHVLGLPPAFILSQDQTLKLKFDPFDISKDLIVTLVRVSGDLPNVSSSQRDDAH